LLYNGKLIYNALAYVLGVWLQFSEICKLEYYFYCCEFYLEINYTMIEKCHKKLIGPYRRIECIPLNLIEDIVVMVKTYYYYIVFIADMMFIENMMFIEDNVM